MLRTRLALLAAVIATHSLLTTAEDADESSRLRVRISDVSRAAQPASGTPTTINGTHIQSSGGMCLDAGQPFLEGSNLHMWPCQDGNTKEAWDFEFASKQIKHSHGGLCLQAPTLEKRGKKKAPLVSLATCDPSNDKQHWEFQSTGELKSASTGLCLDGSEQQQGNVHAQPCEEGRQSQRWRMTGTLDCSLTAWSQFTACTRTCGQGVQKRVRVVISEPQGEGKECGHLVETRTCHKAACAAPGECKVGAWGAWSRCTHRCGGGSQLRTRDVLIQASDPELGCPVLHESRECNTHGCSVHYSADDSNSEPQHDDTDDAAVISFESLTTNTSRLTEEEQHILTVCEASATAIADLTVQKATLQRQLNLVTAARNALDLEQEERKVVADDLIADNTNLTSRLLETESELEKEQILASTAAKEKQPIVTDAQLKHENKVLVSRVKYAELNITQQSVLTQHLGSCREESLTLQGKLDDARNQIQTMQAETDEQGKQLENCTLHESTVAAQRDAANDRVAAVQMQHQVNGQLLEKCRTERDSLALKIYDSEADLLTANMTNKKQGESLDKCVEDTKTLSSQATTADGVVATVTSEKEELQKQLTACQEEKDAAPPASEAMLDSSSNYGH